MRWRQCTEATLTEPEPRNSRIERAGHCAGFDIAGTVERKPRVAARGADFERTRSGEARVESAGHVADFEIARTVEAQGGVGIGARDAAASPSR